MNTRHKVINKIGSDYLTTNIENDEFSYCKALGIPNKGPFKLDLRFENENISILIEIKNTKAKKFTKSDEYQLFSYANLERKYRQNNKIVSILYNLKSGCINVWKEGLKLDEENSINSFDYYKKLFDIKINSKNNVINTTNQLNNELHSLSIPEKYRSQFVGSLLVALNNKLEYDFNLTTDEIINRLCNVLSSKIDNDENKEKKTKLLINILKNQEIREIKNNKFINLLNLINNNLIPFIDTRSDKGEDLLNLFFTTFNKYVAKDDKNQAFTPTHITDFMCDITNLNKNSIVLDPTCGSGSFLVQAMTKMLKKAGKDEMKRIEIKSKQIYGIEKDETAFGLATTNMLIHEDGKSNVILGSCFDKLDSIKRKNINIVLMNPPFNGQKMPSDCPTNKNKNMDATKGLYFVEYIASAINNGMLATILPLQCAIGNDLPVRNYKEKMLKNHTLKAVFSLPNEIFHPGASVNTCIMLFDLGIPHNMNKKTFFGYYKDDGFIKKKNKGRVEKKDWEITKKEWLTLFEGLKEKPGYSVLRSVSFEDEWLAEAYMETDYTDLKEKDFIQSIRDFIAFKVKNGEIND